MFDEIGNYHDDGIDNGQKNQQIAVIPFFIRKIKDDHSKKKEQCIYRGKHMESFPEPSLENHNDSPLASATETFDAQEFLTGAG